MNEWIFSIDEYAPEDVALNGNRFMLGNGYMGVRGTLEEHGARELAGVMLNGVYDQAPGKWREPVNAPNPLRAFASDPGAIRRHEQSLDLRRGRLTRRTEYDGVSVRSERFVSMDDVHLICMRFEADGGRVVTDIDTDVWDINGPHFEIAEKTDDLVVARTLELGITVVVATEVEWESASAFKKYVAIFTSLDLDDPVGAAKARCREAREIGYEALGRAHDAAWERIWRGCDVRIEGDEEARFALRYSLYQLQLAAPRHSDRVSIPARALSGQVYKGAVFWDTEMFMTPVFTLTDPSVARNLIMYRYHTLDGAREKAAEYGYRGAFYAWEGQERGNDACTHFNVTDVFTGRPMRTYFRDKQIHISADIVYAVARYVEQTADFSVLVDGAAEIVAECARFFYSHAYYKKERDQFEFLDVTGPDEYHERVGNNAYTNRLARFTMDTALKTLAELEARAPAAYAALERKIGFEAELEDWRETAAKIRVPEPDAETRVIPQFDGYEKLEDCSLEELKSRVLDPREYWGGGSGLATTTKILKQADVVLMLHLFRSEYDRETLRANWEYYEPRTEHGSSLSACAYAMVAAEIGDPDWAYDYFMKTATVDLTGKSKQYVGPLYIGGTHPAANGGAWLSAVLGFAGLRVSEEGIEVNPRLPSRWSGLSFPIMWRGRRHRVAIEGDAYTVTPLEDASDD